MKTFIVALVLTTLVLLYWYGARRANRSMASRFSARQDLEFDVFYEKYYAGKLQQNLVKELLEHVAQELSVPASKLLPSDRFEVELRPVRGWEFDSGKGILFVEIDKLARKKGVRVDTKAIVTLDDYLIAMAKVY